MRRLLSEKEKRTRKRACLLSFLLPLFAAVMVFGYAALFLFCERRGIPLFRCILKEKFGFYCPGCGGSRALLSLLRGDFVSSFYFYPAMIPAALLLFDLYVRLVVTAVTGDWRAASSFRFRAFYAVFAIVLLTFLVRGLLWFGFGIDALGDLSSRTFG